MAKPTVTLNSVMDDWKKFAEASKQASEQERISAQSIPGGERNSSKEVPAEDPLVKDKQVAPAANRENVPGSDTNIPAPGVATIQPTEGAGVAVADKPLTDPTPTLDKQAEVSRIGDLANAIVSSIVKHNESVKVAAEAKSVENKPAESKLPAIKTEGPKTKEAKPVVANATSATAPAVMPDSAKEAGLNMELTTEVLAKIAAIVCSTEDGAAFVQAKLEAAIGSEKTAMVDEYMSKQAEAYGKQMTSAQAEYDAGVKYAEALLNDPMFKLGQAMGMESLGMAPGGAPEGGLPPEAMAEPAMPPGAEAGPGAGEDITPEDIIGALQDMVQAGELDEATATQLVGELMGGAEGGAPVEGGAPTESPAQEAIEEGTPAGETPPEATPEHEAKETPAEEKKEDAAEEGAAKEAALKTFSAIFKKAQASRQK